MASTYMRPLEFACWWGPEFSDDLVAIPLGITHHKASDRQRIFSGVQWTEFWWHEQNDLKTLECKEEVLDIPTLGAGRKRGTETLPAARYVHSIVDPERKTPFHLDGAVPIYNNDGEARSAGREHPGCRTPQ